jgi:hypothetical protein
VAVDSSAAITVGGRVNGGFFVAGLDQFGNWSWISSGLAAVRGGASEEALCVRVSPGSNVFAAGYAQPNDPLALRFTLKSFDAFGLFNWQQQLGVSEGLQGAATSLALDSRGNVAACGYLESASRGEDFVTASFTPAGVLRGQKSINGTANGDDRALAVTVDKNGWTTAAGKVRNNVVHQLFPAVSTGLDDFAVSF